jgi:hypothetical protein
LQILLAFVLAPIHTPQCLVEKVKDCPFNKDDLGGLSLHMVAEIDANPPTPASPVDPGFFASFWMYPKAEALS